MKFRSLFASGIILACLLVSLSGVAQGAAPPPTPPTPPEQTQADINRAAQELAQDRKLFQEQKQGLEKREATLDRAMGVLNTSIAVFGDTMNIWTIILTVIGVIIAIIAGLGFFEYRRLKDFRVEVEGELKKAKDSNEVIAPIVAKIKEHEKEAETVRQQLRDILDKTVGTGREMQAGGKGEELSAEMKAKLEGLAQKIEFLEVMGVSLKPEDYLNKGRSFFANKEYDKALIAFDHALSGNDKLADAWFWKGRTLQRLERHEDALAALEEAIKLNPKDSAAWNNKGVSLNRLKRYEDALAALEEAIKLDPKDDVVWSNKGWALVGLGKKEEAIKAYKQASFLTAEPAWKLYLDANLLAIEGKRKEALAALKSAVAINAERKESALRNIEVWGSFHSDPEFIAITKK